MYIYIHTYVCIIERERERERERIYQAKICIENFWLKLTGLRQEIDGPQAE